MNSSCLCISCRSHYDTQKNTKVNLGSLYPSLFIDSPVQTILLKKSPLALSQCPFCGFVQLTEFLEPDEMYRKYWYRSGLNNSMIEALQDVVDSAILRLSNHKPKRVMDIGCNDGTLLSFYNEEAFKVGYDPANNLEQYAIKNCDVFVNDYFNRNIAFKEPFDIITSIAMFYDLENPQDFVSAIKKYLDKNGIWVVQMTDLTCTLMENAYDNICHEHIAYYTLHHLKDLVQDFGLEIFDVEYNGVNGRSVRAYVGNKGRYKVAATVEDSLLKEKKILRENDWSSFNQTIQNINFLTVKKIREINETGQKIFGLGASTKGNTLLQVCGLTERDIPAILEVSKDKFGKYCAGSNIPIISEQEGLAQNPDYLLVLPWHFTDFFLEKKKDYLQQGGKFLVPMPKPGVWSWEGGLKFESL